MTITRRTLHDEIWRLDDELAEIQSAKKAAFDAYREQLEADGQDKRAVRDEIGAFKKAERKFRALEKDADAALELDALVDEIVEELRHNPSGTPVATRAPAPRATRTPEPAARNASGEAVPCQAPPATRGAASSLSPTAASEAPDLPAVGGEPVPYAVDVNRLPLVGGAGSLPIPDDLSIPEFLRRY